MSLATIQQQGESLMVEIQSDEDNTSPIRDISQDVEFEHIVDMNKHVANSPK